CPARPRASRAPRPVRFGRTAPRVGRLRITLDDRAGASRGRRAIGDGSLGDTAGTSSSVAHLLAALAQPAASATVRGG
ncbi:MAG: hypothetical protein AVDCRST_MAG19-4325, partial [uncultured Thermomicrobiales bacterium]